MASSVYKTKFRQSKIWKDFRKKMMQIQKIDQLTHKKLLKGFALHHLDMSAENYKDLNPNKFRCLNKQSHECVHFLFRYYVKDRDVLKRLKKILDEMLEYNS